MAAAEATQPAQTLESMPSLLPLYGRAGFAAVPGSGLLGRLPLLPGGGRGKDLPSERLRVEGVAAERAGGKTGFALRGPEPDDPPLHLAGELAPLA